MVKYRAAIWSFLKLTALHFTMSDIVHLTMQHIAHLHEVEELFLFANFDFCL